MTFTAKSVVVACCIAVAFALPTIALVLGRTTATVQQQTGDNCRRQQVSDRYAVALGDVIFAARQVTAQDKERTAAGRDFIAQVRVEHQTRHATIARLFHDLAVMIGGTTGQPTDTAQLVAAEDSVLKLRPQLAKPRTCP